MTPWPDCGALERQRVVELLRDEAAARERLISSGDGRGLDVGALRRQAEAYRAAAAVLVAAGE